jgi:hypothetical protein
MTRMGLWFAATRSAACAVVAVGTLFGSATAARADSYKDEKLGFSLSTPSKWKQMPISTDERWLVAEWKCPRPFEWQDPKTGMYTTHEPKLDVIVIPNSAAKQRGAEVTKTDDKIIIKQAAPWKDVKEYMDKKAQSDWEVRGGYFFSREDPIEVGGMKVMVYEITFEKLTTPRKWYGWAFYAEDAIYGLIGDALVKYEEKLKPDYDAAFRSFKLFPRKGVLPGAEVTPDDDDGDVILKKDPKKEHVTDDDLKKRRTETFNRRLARIKDSLSEGWKIKESENFVAVTHCDDKFTKEVLDHAEALRGWLDKNFGFVGSGYAGRIILRVCADDNERDAMWKSMGWSSDRCEVVTGKDRSGWMDNKMSSLNSGIYDIWFKDRNKDLYYRMPAWIRTGMDSVISCAVSKGKSITDFKATTWNKVQMDELRRADKLLPARQFFTMDPLELWKDWTNHQQTEAFVRWLLIGGAQKSSKYKTLLGDYIKNLAILIDEMNDKERRERQKAKEAAEAAKEGEGGDASSAPEHEEPKNEEEEAAMRRQIDDEWGKAQQRVLQQLLEQTFKNWDDKDWNQFNEAYKNGIGG